MTVLEEAAVKDKENNKVELRDVLDEPRRKKTGFLHMRKQRRRSASR